MNENVEEKAISLLKSLIRNERNRNHEVSLEELKLVILKDVENIESSIAKRKNGKKEYIDKKQKLTDAKEIAEIDEEINKLNKGIKLKEKHKKILIKSIEIIENIVKSLEVKEFENYKEENTISEFEKALSVNLEKINSKKINNEAREKWKKLMNKVKEGKGIGNKPKKEEEKNENKYEDIELDSPIIRGKKIYLPQHQKDNNNTSNIIPFPGTDEVERG